MADPLWVLNVSLQGGTQHNKTSLAFILEYDGGATPMTFTQASSAAGQIVGALDDICDATVSTAKLSYLMQKDGSMPNGAVDTADEAVVMCHVNATGSVPKFTAVRVPAPLVGEVFLPDGETVDISNSLLVQYIQQVAQHAYVSDAERVNTSEGSNGMAYGFKRSRAKRYG